MCLNVVNGVCCKPFPQKDTAMKFAGCDLHKQTITICVVDQSRRVLERRTVRCCEERSLLAFFETLGDFEAVVEATASYEWFVRLIEPLAQRVVLAHPKKLRVIAESTRKKRSARRTNPRGVPGLGHDSDLLSRDSAAAGASAISAPSRGHSTAIDVCQKPDPPHSLRL